MLRSGENVRLVPMIRAANSVLVECTFTRKEPAVGVRCKKCGEEKKNEYDSMIHCYQLSRQQQCKSKGDAEGEMPSTTWVIGLRQCTPPLWV